MLIRENSTFDKDFGIETNEEEDLETEPAEDFDAKRLSDVFETPEKLTAPNEPIPTGFAELDNALNGGLIPQLYVLGAESSTGKSTFMLNVSEQIARSNRHVMYFSLEMPRDYIARLIICHCLIAAERERGNELSKDLALRNFTSKGGPEKLIENSEFKRAFGEYKKLGKYFYIFERDTPNFNGQNIFDKVRGFKSKFKDSVPIVIVDYLQILDGKDDNHAAFNQRAVVDYNVGLLTQTANELKVPVIAISSLNRSSYNGKTEYSGKQRDIRMSDFKESGRIEYSADVVMALQSAQNSSGGGIQKRTLKLSLLKNRYGEKDVNVRLLFYPEFGLFRDGAKPTPGLPSEDAEQSALEKTSGGENKWILNSRISIELHQKRDNYGVHKRLHIGSNYHISYLLRRIDDNKDDGEDSLTLWDLAVMDAVYSVTNQGKKSAFTVTGLYKFMCGKSRLSNRSDQITEKFKDALKRLANREIIIDITEALQMRGENSKDSDSAKDEDRLNAWLDARVIDDGKELKALAKDFGKTYDRKFVKGTLLSHVEERENSFRLIEGDKPILFEYTANLLPHYINYDPKLWAHLDSAPGEGSPTDDDRPKYNFTKQRLLIRYYLIRSISIMKYKGGKYARKVTVYRQDNPEKSLLAFLVLSDDSKLGKLKDRSIKNLKSYKNLFRWLKSACEDTEMILNDLKAHGFISYFKNKANEEDEDKTNGDLVYLIGLPQPNRE